MNVAGFLWLRGGSGMRSLTSQKSVVTLEGYRSVQSWPFLVNSLVLASFDPQWPKLNFAVAYFA
jgi:hypothetical protein